MTTATPLHEAALMVLRVAVHDQLAGYAYMRDGGPCPHGLDDHDCAECHAIALAEVLDNPARYLFNNEEIADVAARNPSEAERLAAAFEADLSPAVPELAPCSGCAAAVTPWDTPDGAGGLFCPDCVASASKAF